ncbi:ribosome-associated GTPase [Babesia ovis]|uniref:GTPase Der n=1 Tax=Babesia ovis TaxID=5869 RepID=A0A9W5TDD7_BABOV|nr:ribosome-associated GTPase [Babesia ovis]
MSQTSDLIEQLLLESECVTIPVITQALGLDTNNSIQSTIEFAGGKDITLVYSVCYTDDHDNVVLSHKTKSEIEGHKNTGGDFQPILFGIQRNKSANNVDLEQICWDHEFKVLGKGLKEALHNSNLHIPSYTKLITSEIRIRRYDRSQQGDSALCTPINKPLAAQASQPRSTDVKQQFKQEVKQHSNPTSKQQPPLQRDDPPKRAKTTTSHAAVTKKTVSDGERVKEDVQPKPSATKDSTTEASIHTANMDAHKATSGVEAKDTSVSPSNMMETSSLFSNDDPCDDMDLDVPPSYNKQPASYVEKVTKETTYVDSGYFVVEESDEYVQVTEPIKSVSAVQPKFPSTAPSMDGSKRSAPKRSQKNLNQSSLMDRQYALADWNGCGFRLIDTGGLEDDNAYADSIREQVGNSLEEAHVAIVVVDGQAGLTDADMEVRNFVIEATRRNRNLRILLCVNKCESFHFGDVLAEQFWRLGLGQPYPVSALHGTGLAELLNECLVGFDQVQIEDEHDVIVSFIGRPNCGKSSLINLLAGTNRCLVSPNEGTTLDTVEIPIVRDEKRYLMIDTAGMRIQSKDRISFLPKGRSLRAIRKSDVCVLVVDANWGISRNDVKLAEEIKAESKAAVIVCNKWDLIDKDPTVYKNAVSYVKEKLHWLDYADVIFTSAKSGQRVGNILEACANAHEQYAKSFPTALLNDVLREATFLQKPPVTHGRRLNIYYACQVHSKPPGIALFCNDERLLTDDYAEYLEVFFRRSLNLTGSPINLLEWLPQANPYLFPFDAIYQTTNAYIKPFQTLIPPIHGVDISNIVAFFVLDRIEFLLAHKPGVAQVAL